MNWYTVILLYPDNVADQFGESYVTWLQADTPLQAQTLAREEAAAINEVEDPNDFAVVAVFLGDHPNLKEEDE